MLATAALAILANVALVAAQCSPTTTSAPPPPPTGTVLHPNGDAKKCLDVQGANFANGTPVQIWDCNGTPAQQWTLARGAGAVKLAANGTNFCLDAGLNPANGVGMKIWECFSGVSQQNFYYTDDNRIALTVRNCDEGKLTPGFCLDLPSGSKTNGNRIQLWECGTGNTNQVWTTNALLNRRRLNE